MTRRLSGAVVVGLAGLALAAVSGCAAAHGPIRWEDWRSTYPESYGTPLAEKAAAYRAHVEANHLSPEGVLVYVRDRAEPFDPDAAGSYRNLSDTPIWQGAFVAGAAFEASRTGAPEDRELLLRALRGLRFLHDVTGVPGLFARAVLPRRHASPGDVEGEWRDAPAPHDAWIYRGDVSRDQYCGVLFGATVAAARFVLGRETPDAEVRDELLGFVPAVADHVWESGLRIVDADGEVTKHGDLRGYLYGVPISINAALALGFQRLAGELTGDARFQARYDDLVARRYPNALRIVKVEFFGDTNHNNDNMAMMGLDALTRLEDDPELLAIYDRALARLWELVRHEGNVFWNLVYASRHELPGFARFDTRENLRLYPADPIVRHRDVRALEPVRRAQFRDRFHRPKNVQALPAHLREHLGDFMWKNCPYALVDSEPPLPPRSASGVGFLLGYWMAYAVLGDPETIADDLPELPREDA